LYLFDKFFWKDEETFFATIQLKRSRIVIKEKKCKIIHYLVTSLSQKNSFHGLFFNIELSDFFTGLDKLYTVKFAYE